MLFLFYNCWIVRPNPLRIISSLLTFIFLSLQFCHCIFHYYSLLCSRLNWTYWSEKDISSELRFLFICLRNAKFVGWVLSYFFSSSELVGGALWPILPFNCLFVWQLVVNLYEGFLANFSHAYRSDWLTKTKDNEPVAPAFLPSNLAHIIINGLNEVWCPVSSSIRAYSYFPLLQRLFSDFYHVSHARR